MDIVWEVDFYTDEPQDQHAELGSRYWARIGPGREHGAWWYNVLDRQNQNMIVMNGDCGSSHVAKTAVRQWAEKHLAPPSPAMTDERLLRLVRELAGNYHNGLLGAETAMAAIAAAVL